jgi:hypothetical protein
MPCPGIISLVFYEFHVPATIPFNGTFAGAVSKPDMNMLVQTDLIVLNIYKSSVIYAKYPLEVWRSIYKTQNSTVL